MAAGARVLASTVARGSGACISGRAAPRLAAPPPPKLRPGSRRDLRRSPSRAPVPHPPQISMRVDVKFVKDVLNGDETTELRVSLREVLSAGAGGDYREE